MDEKKPRELYQLVAISNNIEYVIELKNDNKNQKGCLEFIDSGTTRFKDEKQLAAYLYNNGKLPTMDVKFAIKYNYNGYKYLPAIFNDKEFCVISKNVGNTDVYNDYVFHFLKLIETEMFSDPNFYYYILRRNENRAKKLENGNYINQKLIDSIMEYFNAYVKYHNIDANKADLQYDILKELYNYKQLRTLRSFYLDYKGGNVNRILPNNETGKIK